MIDVATTSDRARTAPVPRGWVAKYLLGTAVLVGLFIGALISSDRAVGQLVADIRAANVASCASTPQPQCRADYPAVLTDVTEHSDSTEVLIRTRFLATTDPTDECFDHECSDEVHVRTSDGHRIHGGQHATISAGNGRIFTIRTDTTSVRTYDDPSISALNSAANLTWTLYLDGFAATWLVAYLFLTLNMRLWRVTATAIRRGLNFVSVASLLGSIVTFIGYAYGGPQPLIVIAVGLLISAAAASFARRHPETQQPVAEFVADKHWTAAVNRSLLASLYVLGGFPLPLFVAVALGLAHDKASWVSPLIATLIGVVLAAFIVWRIHRRVRRSRPAK
jgi:hypothetical protein